MKSFISIVGQKNYVVNAEKNMLATKIIDYIFGNINDRVWQNSIAERLRKNKTDRVIRYCYRLFSREDIEKEKHRSYAKYFSKKTNFQ